MRFFKVKLMLSSLGISLAIGLTSAPVLAFNTDEINQNSYQRDFKMLDKDSDGKLSASEIKKDSMFDFTSFSRADKNHNGSLNQDEYSTHKSAVQQKETKQAAADSAITTKIKSKYLVEKNFKSFKVSVETKDNIVILSGFVNDQATKNRAAQIAAGVKGVKSVKNSLVIKP
jgi:hyperosmotically inducible periplasmic protein